MNRGAKISHYYKYKSSEKKCLPIFGGHFLEVFIQILTADEKLFATAASSV